MSDIAWTVVEGHGDRAITMRELGSHLCRLQHHQTEVVAAGWTGLVGIAGWTATPEGSRYLPP